MGKGKLIQRSRRYSPRRRMVAALALLTSSIISLASPNIASADTLVCVHVWRETNGVRSDIVPEQCHVPTSFTGPMGPNFCQALNPPSNTDKICIKVEVKAP